MSWQVVAKRRLLDPYRSRYLWVVLAVTVLLFGGGVHMATRPGLVSMLRSLGALFVSLLAIASSYRTIAEPHQTGSLRVVLSYPNSRRDVVVGTAVGRSLYVVGIISVGYLVAGAISLVTLGADSLLSVAIVWFAAVLFGVSLTVLAVGVSAASRTVNRAAIASFTFVLLFFGGWNLLLQGIRYVLNGFSTPQPPQPGWVDVFVALNPMHAFVHLVQTLHPTQTLVYESSVHTTTWFGILVLVCWALVPATIGGWLFERRDL
ncbi:ABC transporter permease subunit [Halocatena pleomorpha]|uniref:ABC transporter permease n=1 Tax=Halocatena pleomorpha TaxID=1785090 RepID=A0A3P3RL12_9EURY|nr:ABC transporter permease subunit [Halocatena pleomorpha]RRJ33499.1 ABC transporter permease [Halocatena pleomorpha]